MIEQNESLQTAKAPVFTSSVHRAHELAPHVAFLGVGLPDPNADGPVPVLLQLLSAGRGDVLLYFPSPDAFLAWCDAIWIAYDRARKEWLRAEDRKTNQP